MAINNNKKVGSAAAAAGVAAGAGIGIAGAKIVNPVDDSVDAEETTDEIVAEPAVTQTPPPPAVEHHVHHVHHHHAEPVPADEPFEGVDDNGAEGAPTFDAQQPDVTPGVAPEPGTPYTPEPSEPYHGDTPTPAPADPEIEVIAYDTVTNEDGGSMDIATLSIDGQEVYLADVDMDTYADYALADLNHNGQIDADEIEDVSDHRISMQPFADAAPASESHHEEVMVEPQEEVSPVSVDPVVTDPAISDPGSSYDDGGDYINDANVDDYMG